MIRKEYSEPKKVERIETYYEHLCTEYHVICDDCGRELDNGEEMYEVTLCKNYEEEETKILCKECVKKAALNWINSSDEAEIIIDHDVVDKDTYVGKTSRMSEDLYKLFKEMKIK